MEQKSFEKHWFENPTQFYYGVNLYVEPYLHFQQQTLSCFQKKIFAAHYLHFAHWQRFVLQQSKTLRNM